MNKPPLHKRPLFWILVILLGGCACGGSLACVAGLVLFGARAEPYAESWSEPTTAEWLEEEAVPEPEPDPELSVDEEAARQYEDFVGEGDPPSAGDRR